MIGTRILHYEIREKIGHGGMGEVYLARDTRLGRDVALKFLPEELQRDHAASARLIREARAASRLSHPRIVAVHAVEEFGGRSFIVMEYVPGRSLDEVLAADRLSVARAVEIATGIAEALVAAHEERVVHRDIKPSNIILTDHGGVKVLDFGLATFSGAPQITEAGSTLGTVAYMSPEQTRGEDVDHRTDIFSLGIVLYEMIAGRRPFEGEHRTAISYAIVNDDPPPLERSRTGIPADVERIVLRALQKDPAERYARAADLLSDLEAAGPRAGTPRRPGVPEARSRRRASIGVLGAIAVVAIGVLAAVVLPRLRNAGVDGSSRRVMLAVLPFENLGVPEDEYFADGMTEEITARLARVEGLGVIARTSTLQYKGTNKRVGQIGEELGVDYVLEGTVRWQHAASGTSRVKVTPELVRVDDATGLWADVFDRPLTEVFQVQSDIALEVVRELGVALLESARADLGARPTENLEAYDYYLRGRDYFYRKFFDEKSYQIAMEMFERAVKLDTGFVLAYCELSKVYSDMYWFHFDRSEERLHAARTAVDRALALDPSSPEAHEALGWYYYHGKSDYQDALREFSDALEKRPNDARLRAAVAYVQRRQGKWVASLENLRNARALNPRDAQVVFSIGETSLYLRRFDDAKRDIDAARMLAPDLTTVHVYRIWVDLFGYGDVSAARRHLDAASDLTDQSGLEYVRWYVAFIERDYPAALAALSAGGGRAQTSQFFYWPVEMHAARTLESMGRGDEARAQWLAARDILQAKVAAHPDDPRFLGALGIVHAELGEEDEALECGRRSVQMLPISSDAMKATHRHYEMALTDIVLQRYDDALDELEFILSVPSLYSPERLRLEPFFDPLRDLERFQELVGRS